MPRDNQTVLVVGSGAHHMTLGRMCARAFETLGCDVEFFDKRIASIPVLGWPIGLSRMRTRLVERCRAVAPDLVFVVKGEHLTADIITKLRDTGAVVCNWNPDNPFRARETDRRLETYLGALKAYDEVFIWSDELFEPLRKEGAESVHESPFGFDPEYHHPAGHDSELSADVVFAGHWSEKRQTLLSPLVELDAELAIYGNGWRRHCFDLGLRSCYRGTAVFGERYSKLYCSSVIAINIVADHNLDAYNMRTFEIPATGTFMLTSRTAKQRSIFGEDEGIACFDGPDELRDRVAYYLEHNDKRAAIASRGYELIQDHSYVDRMKAVIEATGSGTGSFS